jgi:putative Holliday junction resolvase
MPVVPIKELKTLLPRGKRLLGIDHGEKTWGLALSNPELTMATPLKTIHRARYAHDMAVLAGTAKEYEVGGFVIGLPLNMDASEGPRAQAVRHFAQDVLKALDLPLAFQDERLSTHAVEQLLIEELNMPRDKRKQVIDAHAAAYILNDALKAMS